MRGNSDRGFTLAEQVAVMAIIGILSALFLGATFTAIQKARDVQIQSDLRAVAIDVYGYADAHGFPEDANPGIEPTTNPPQQIVFPVEPGRTLDYDSFCVDGVRWVKVLSYPTSGRTDNYLQPGSIGVWTHTGRDWALTLWTGKC